MARVPTTPLPASGTRPMCELGEIFRRYGGEYARTHTLSAPQRRVMRDLARCRTAALGGHVDACRACGQLQIAYNSCRNRHCPKCQGAARARWVAQREAELLPLEYFHLVFTLPETLRPLLRDHQRLLLELLFRAAAETLLEFGTRHLGGQLGITAVLHTWGQTLIDHPHLHCIVSGGALAPDRQAFTRCRSGYLFPTRALARVFRGKYCAHLQREARRVAAESLATVLPAVRRQEWVVYAKRPFGGPELVLRYLGRYTHRVALTNARLRSIEAGQIRFTWKDYRDGGRHKELTLGADEFIRRFLLHVLPPAFVRIRHYGFLAGGQRHANLARCRELLGARTTGPAAAAEISTARPEPPQPPHAARPRCLQCGSDQLVRCREFTLNAKPPGAALRRPCGGGRRVITSAALRKRRNPHSGGILTVKRLRPTSAAADTPLRGVGFCSARPGRPPRHPRPPTNVR